MKESMKKLILSLFAMGMVSGAYALEPIKLKEPNLARGKSLMESLSQRKSVRNFKKETLSHEDLSDLLWAANGVSRPDGRRTAPSAMNKQDIQMYVVMEDGTYFYNHKTHTLEPVSSGDHRQKIRGSIPAINIVLVAEDGEAPFAAINAGYVSQNIYLACTALDMATVAAAGLDEQAYIKACGLKTPQKAIIHHPVGYAK